MAYFNVLLQHQGPLTHVNHAHRVNASTGSYWSADKGAAVEANHLNKAAHSFMSSPEGFTIVEKEMRSILNRIEERDYAAYLRGYSDYRDALAYLGHHVLGQSSVDSAWYDMKRKVVQFMFYTADVDALKHVRHTMSYSDDANKFYNVLGRFQTLALSRNDGEAANMAGHLLGSMQ